MNRLAATLVISAIVGTSAFGFEIGDTVVVIRDTDLKVEDHTVDRVFPGLPLRIGDIKCNWLWVCNNHPGWLESRHVVTLNQAPSVLNGMIRQDPWNARLHYRRAFVWIARKEYDVAVADLNAALRLDPEAIYYVGRGLAYHSKGEYDKAIADYTEALRLDPEIAEIAEVYCFRGAAWNWKGEYDRAIADLNKALGIDPKLVYAYDSRGFAWVSTGRFDKAVADYNEGLRLDPKDACAYNGLAWVWAACPNERYRNGKKAVDYATKACTLSGWKVATDFDTLAAAYAETGDFSQAIKWAQKAIVLAPADEKVEIQSRLHLYRQRKACSSQVTPARHAEPQADKEVMTNRDVPHHFV